MFIAITQDDWMKLSLTTRRELKRFIADQFRVTEDESSDMEIEQVSAMHELNDQMVRQLMVRVLVKTSIFLKCFVRDGKGRVDELLEATGYGQQQDFRGILAGITRRMRKLLSDPDAYLIDWEDDAEVMEWGGYYYIKEGTRQALENYFNSLEQ